MAEIPFFDEKKCDGCGLCVSVCTCGGLELKGKLVIVKAGVTCRWCGMCELVCPSGAISCPFEIIIEEDSD